MIAPFANALVKKSILNAVDKSRHAPKPRSKIGYYLFAINHFNGIKKHRSRDR